MRVTGWNTSSGGRIVSVSTDEGLLQIRGISDVIFRCIYTREESVKETSSIGITEGPSVRLETEERTDDGILRILGRSLRLDIALKNGRFTWYRRMEEAGEWELLLQEGDKELTPFMAETWSTGGEEPLVRRVRTVDGDRNFIDNLRPAADHKACRAKLRFIWQEDEQIHGLGQAEEGIFNYRHHVQYLYQHNMRIPMPWILSDRGYAVLADCGCLMTFYDDERGAGLDLDTVDQLDYYVITGKNAEELIRGMRRLTGKAAMLPRWAFGYVQSKERYESQEELLETAREYRTRRIGLDCIVQDWKTWSGDRWGEKRLDPARFPDRGKMREELHRMHVHSMVSVWPNMNYDTADCEQMRKAGCLLHDLATYDAFSEEGRRLYWEQARDGLYKDGFDSWWCDSTEPFSGPDWGGETKREPRERFMLVGQEHKKYLGGERANLYALYHAKGMYENQRADDPAHRMLNLTRSGYAGIQQYGAVLWSGDTAAKWSTLRTQLTESLNMAMSGYPYWTFDAGAFFTVKDNWQARGCGCNEDPTPKWFWQGDFEEGVKDPGYRELYVRWLQMAIFLPMMRSHGTDTPREIWQFGEPGTPWYDAIARAIALRYRLMPYIYSLAGAVWLEDGMMERPLLFDFPQDKKAAAADDAFLFGSSLLICPVTRPMEYGPGGEVLDGDHTWQCYLPEGSGWYCFEEDRASGTDRYGMYQGGRTVELQADLQTIPVFVKAGSILPMEEALEYACEETKTPLQIHIWPGADAQFALYEDDGDGYAYEEGIYNRVSLEWNDQERVLKIGSAPYHFPGGIRGRRCAVMLHHADSKGSTLVREFTCSGGKMEVSFRQTTGITGRDERYHIPE